MKKIEDMIINETYYKYYRLQEETNPLCFFQTLLGSGIEFDVFFVEEDAEMDMKIYAGYYNMESFAQKWPLMKQIGMDYNFTVPVRINNHDAEIGFSSVVDVVSMGTSDKSLELTEFIKE